MELYELYKLEETIGVPIVTMSRFLEKLEGAYKRQNPYHNSTHAADVMHAMHFFLTKLEMKELLQVEVNHSTRFLANRIYIHIQEVYACLIAAAIHDVDHPGFNNSFLISTLHPLALRYNDQSVRSLVS